MSIKNKKEQLTESQKRIIAIAVFGTFLIFCAAVGWFIGKPMIEFVSAPQEFRAWVNKSGILGKIIFILMVAFQVVIALVPGEPLEIGAGYGFGGIEGTILCVIGITLGSLFVFCMVRKFGVKLVEIFFSTEKINSLKFLKDSKKRDVLIFLIFFMPGTPKDLITYFAGLTKIKTTHFLLLASIARLPSVITSTVGGGALGTKNYKMAIIVFSITIIVSICGWFVYTIIHTRKGNKLKEE